MDFIIVVSYLCNPTDYLNSLVRGVPELRAKKYFTTPIPIIIIFKLKEKC